MNPIRQRKSHELLCEIVRCPEVAKSGSDGQHPCSEIVTFQDRFPSDFQPPTPWVGRLSEAPILFIGSNPNISGREYYPSDRLPDDELVDFFDYAFEGEGAQIKDGMRARQDDGRYGGAVRTWTGVRGRARELLMREPVPGVDYAMTEVVRCRSWDERGVRAARDHCADLYLDRTVALSPARVIVALGAHVRGWLRKRWDLKPNLISEKELEGLNRLSPSFRTPRRLDQRHSHQ